MVVDSHAWHMGGGIAYDRNKHRINNTYTTYIGTYILRILYGASWWWLLPQAGWWWYDILILLLRVLFNLPFLILSVFWAPYT